MADMLEQLESLANSAADRVKLMRDQPRNPKDRDTLGTLHLLEHIAGQLRALAAQPAIFPQNGELAICPFCIVGDRVVHPNALARSGAEMGVPDVDSFYVHCDGCGADGPIADSEQGAETLWNRWAIAAQHTPVVPLGFYLASFKHKDRGGAMMWWRADNAGYTPDIEQAGIYTEITPGYHDSDYTVPVPVSFLDGCRIRRTLDPGDSKNRAFWSAADLRAAVTTPSLTTKKDDDIAKMRAMLAAAAASQPALASVGADAASTNIVEQIAQQWDECYYDDDLSGTSIGDRIRQAARRHRGRAGWVLRERPILFSASMVRAIRAGTNLRGCRAA